MTQDEIIELAKQAGYQHPDAVGQCEDFAYFELEAFAKLVLLPYQKKIADLENIICKRHWDVLQEREACARIADEWAVSWPHPSVVIAERIRGREQA